MRTVKRLFAPPVFKDRRKTSAAGLLKTMLLASLIGCCLVPLVDKSLASGSWPPVRIVGPVAAVSLGLLLLLRGGHVQPTAILVAGALWAAFAAIMYAYGGIRDPALTGLYFVVILASSISGGLTALAFTVLTILSAAALYYAEVQGILLTSMANPPALDDLIIIMVTLSLSALVPRIPVRQISAAFQLVKQNEDALDEARTELEESRAALRSRTLDLEKLTAELSLSHAELEQTLQISQRRLTMLRASAEVGRSITQIDDLDHLLSQITQLMSEHFGHYHVGIFLVDESGLHALLRAASSAGGQRMLARGHRLVVGSEGIVGYVTGSGRPRIALDVGVDAVHFDNPDLPNTRSEMAVPLRIGDEIVGALDLQSTEVEAFGPEDAAALGALAGQISAAIQNAQLFEKAEAALEKAEEVQRRHEQQAWRQYARQSQTPSVYEYTAAGVPSLGDAQLTEIGLALERNELITLGRDDQPLAETAMAAPIRFRDQVIGALGLHGTRQWSAEELTLVQDVADQIAAALTNARLFEETRRSAADQQMLFEATTVAISTADMDEMFEGVAEAIFDRMSCTDVVIMMVEGANLRRRAGFGLTSRATGTQPLGPLETPIGEGILGRVAQTGEPCIAGDLTGSPHQVATTSTTGSNLTVPIFVDQEVAGVISIESDRHNAFDEKDLRLLQTLSGTLGSILKSTQLVEELQQAYEEIREVDRIKSEFLANMSHELRTPLNSIIGFSRVILKGIDGPITPLQEQDLNSIYNSGRHLLGLINNVLDLSKIEAGKMELSPEVVEVREALDIVLSTAIGLVKGKDVTLTMDVPPDLPPVWMDPIRLRQVLLNLVSNAAKFTVEGIITIQAAFDPQAVFIQVVDTGIGISEEDMDKLFKSFSQVDASSTRRAGGSGLGLAISAQLMELQGGRIWVESQVGVGSTFSVALPRVNANGDGPITILTGEADRAESAGSGPAGFSEEGPTLPQEPSVARLVLAIENDVEVVDLYRRYLTGRGIRLENATTGKQGIERAIELAPQLAAITVDIMMPDMVGWEVIRQLKQNPSTREIPVIICSIVLDRLRAGTLGVEQYLTKPILQDDFINALEACFT